MQRDAEDNVYAGLSQVKRSLHGDPRLLQDFANFFRNTFSSDHHDYDVLPKHLLATITKFSLDGLNKCLQQMANLRCADEHDIVNEMIKNGSS